MEAIFHCARIVSGLDSDRVVFVNHLVTVQAPPPIYGVPNGPCDEIDILSFDLTDLEKIVEYKAFRS